MMRINVILWVFATCMALSMEAQPPIIVVGASSEEERKCAVELLQISQDEGVPTLPEFQQRAEKLGFIVKVQDSNWIVIPRCFGDDNIYNHAAAFLRGLKDLPPQPGIFQFETLPPAARSACREILIRSGELAFSSLTPEGRETLSAAFGKSENGKPLALALMEEGQLVISVNIALRPRIRIGERLLKTAPLVLMDGHRSSLPPDIQARVNQLLASDQKATPPQISNQGDSPPTSQDLSRLASSWRRAMNELRERRGVALTQLTLYFSEAVTPTQATWLTQKYFQQVDHMVQQAQESYKNAMRELIEYWKSHNSFLNEVLPQFGSIPFSSLHPYLQRLLLGQGALQSQILNSGWLELSADDIDIVLSYPSGVVAIPDGTRPIYDWKGYMLSDLMR